MNHLLNLYRSVSPLLAALTPQAAAFSPKLKEGLAGREGIWERLSAGAAAVKGGVWFHVTSVGEYEQARPVIAAIKALPQAPPVMVTHFSPSGYAFAARRPCADLHEYLPLDTPANMGRLVNLWRPRLLVFVKFDLWPNQVLAADQAGVPVFLLAGSLQPRSARLHPVARGMYRDLFDRFAHLGVCTPEDRRRFLDDLRVSCPVTVTGDTRVEQVILRYEAAQDGATAARLKGLGGRIMVLGSTWPPDEKLWLPVLPRLLAEFPDLKVVLTPHEPREPRLQGLERELDRQQTVKFVPRRPITCQLRRIAVHAKGFTPTRRQLTAAGASLNAHQILQPERMTGVPKNVVVCCRGRPREPGCLGRRKDSDRVTTDFAS